MNKNIEEKLANMKLKTLTEGEKSILWSKIEGGIRARGAYGKKPVTILGMSSRVAFAAVLIVFVLTSGSIATVSAANDAVPGDRLFPLDEALERIELFFTRQENRAERRLEFAQERLDEARVIVALADTNGGDTATSTDDTGTSTSTSTSTDDTSTSTDDTSTSTDDTSTSTDETSTSTDDTGSDDDDRPRRIRRAEHVLGVALSRLEDMRERFLAEGNDEAVAEIDEIIADLTELANAHIAFLEAIQDDIREIRDEFREIRDEIRESRDELKFKFDHKVEDEDDEDEDEDEDDNEDGDEDEGKSRGRGFRFRFGKFFNDFDDNRGHGGKTILCHVPPGNPGNAHTISVGSPAAARAHISHGDEEGRCGDMDEDDGDGDEDEDEDEDDEDNENPPEILGISVKDIGHDGATLVCEVDPNGEDTDVNFKWGLSEDELVNVTDTFHVDGDGGSETVEKTIGGLDENTEYFFKCVADNEDGTEKSEIESFMTSELADETSPVISSLDATTTSSTASITWDTDEDADSQYWQSTSTPVDTSGSPDAESSDLVSSHSLDISGLTASTTYFYVISSTDEAGNTAMSTESSFTTLPE